MFVKTELSFYFVTSLTESIFVSVGIERGGDAELQRAVIFLLSLRMTTVKGIVLSLFYFTF